MTTLRPALIVLPRPRRTGRALLLLTLAVTLAHLVLMGWLPLGSDREALPLAQRFSTRTIVIAPPAATGGGSEGTPAPGTAAAASSAPPPTARLRDKPREKPKTPRKPRPKPPPPPPPTEPDALAHAPPPDAQTPTDAMASAVPIPTETPSPDSPATAQADAPDAAADGAPPGGKPASTPGPQAAAGGGGSGGGEGAGQGAGAGAGVPGATQPLKVPGSVRLDFAVTGQDGAQPMSGVFGELIWLQDGSHYNAQLALRVLFRTVRSQTSVGRISAGGIEPERFSDKRRSEVATHFVRDSGQIVFSSTTAPATLLPGAQDRLSVFMQLTALMAGDPQRYGPGTQFSMQVAGPRDADVSNFTVDADETVSTPAGEFQARRLTRLPRKDYDDKIEIWLAPQLDWLPVRIRLTQAKGNWADMQLRNVEKP